MNHIDRLARKRQRQTASDITKFHAAERIREKTVQVGECTEIVARINSLVFEVMRLLERLDYPDVISFGHTASWWKSRPSSGWILTDHPVLKDGGGMSETPRTPRKIWMLSDGSFTHILEHDSSPWSADRISREAPKPLPILSAIERGLRTMKADLESRNS